VLQSVADSSLASPVPSAVCLALRRPPTKRCCDRA
jgi:hypothetical protein